MAVECPNRNAEPAAHGSGHGVYKCNELIGKSLQSFSRQRIVGYFGIEQVRACQHLAQPLN